MLRRRRREQRAARTQSLESLESPWREAVAETVASQERLHALLAQTPDGPVRQRLMSVTERVDSGAAAAFQIGQRAQAASRVVATLEPEVVHERLKQARRGAAIAQAGERDLLEAEVKLLTEQHAAVNQLTNTVEDAYQRLRLLDLRLDAAVARAAQITLGADPSGLVSVEQELGLVVEELAALQAGLDAVRAID